MKQALLDKLALLQFPCHIVAHTPERDYRTRYRGENPGGFNHGHASNIKEAYDIVYPAWTGTIGELTVLAYRLACEEENGNVCIEKIEC